LNVKLVNASHNQKVKIEKSEMGGTCSANGERGVFWWGNLKEGHDWGDPAVDGSIILG
jgi:hypothetical protein